MTRKKVPAYVVTPTDHYLLAEPLDPCPGPGSIKTILCELTQGPRQPANKIQPGVEKHSKKEKFNLRLKVSSGKLQAASLNMNTIK
jgi:hypothetical protein